MPACKAMLRYHVRPAACCQVVLDGGFLLGVHSCHLQSRQLQLDTVCVTLQMQGSPWLPVC